VERLSDVDFINVNILFVMISISQIMIKTVTKLYSISASKLKKIPVVLWKILEVSYKRYAKVLQVIQKNSVDLKPTQDKEFQQVNREEKEFLEAILILYFLKEHSNDFSEHLNAVRYLLQVAKDNFNAQESKMILYHYENFKIHRKAHKEFLTLLKKGISQVESEHFLSVEVIDKIAFWIREHILEHDKEFEKLL